MRSQNDSVRRLRTRVKDREWRQERDKPRDGRAPYCGMLKEEGRYSVDGGHDTQKNHHATCNNRNRLNLHLDIPVCLKLEAIIPD